MVKLISKILRLQERSHWISWGLQEMGKLWNKLGNLRSGPKAVKEQFPTGISFRSASRPYCEAFLINKRVLVT